MYSNSNANRTQMQKYQLFCKEHLLSQIRKILHFFSSLLSRWLLNSILSSNHEKLPSSENVVATKQRSVIEAKFRSMFNFRVIFIVKHRSKSKNAWAKAMTPIPRKRKRNSKKLSKNYWFSIKISKFSKESWVSS